MSLNCCEKKVKKFILENVELFQLSATLPDIHVQVYEICDVELTLSLGRYNSVLSHSNSFYKPYSKIIEIELNNGKH